jgi:hypothetical protein
MATKPQLKYAPTQGQANPKKGNYSSSLIYQMIMQEAQRRGYGWFKQHHALAMMGSFIQETGNFRKDVIDFDVRGDDGSAHGMMQWRDDPNQKGVGRYSNLRRYAKQIGMPAQDPRAQVSFAFEEGVAGSPYADPGSVRAFREFPQAKGVQDATISFIHAERPAGYKSKNPAGAHDSQKRIAHAMKAGGSIEGVSVDEEMQNYDFTSDGEYANTEDKGNNLSFGKGYDTEVKSSFGLPETSTDKNVNQVNSFVNNSASFADSVTKGRGKMSYASMFGVQ